MAIETFAVTLSRSSIDELTRLYQEQQQLVFKAQRMYERGCANVSSDDVLELNAIKAEIGAELDRKRQAAQQAQPPEQLVLDLGM